MGLFLILTEVTEVGGMPELSIHLLGKFCVQHDDQIVDGLEASKVQELFCYLLLHRDRPHSRERLSSLLWGESTTAQSKKYLRQTLWQLQAALDALDDQASSILLVTPGWLQINPDTHFWLDVAIFEQIFALVQGIPGKELDDERARSLQGGVHLYRGDLLEGYYQDWCLYERERLQQLYLVMLDKLMGYCEARRSYEAGLDYGARILSYDRARERTHQQLMRLHYLAGDRAAALRQYERCIAILREELDVEPARGTVALYEQIRRDQLDTSSQEPAKPPALAGVVSPPTTDLLMLLVQLNGTLIELQQRLQQDIYVIQSTLSN